MKNYKNILIVMLLPVFAAILFTGSRPGADDKNVAIIKKAVKDVTQKDAADGSEWIKAKVGMPLKIDDEVRTGSKSLAQILFKDGSGILNVRENAIVHIYGNVEEKKINKDVFLQKGMIGFDVTKQEADEFKFTTPTVVASIRGTNGFVEFGDDSTTTISLGSGSVDFFSNVGTQGSGNVTGGNTAVIDKFGNINVQQSNQQQVNQQRYSQQTNLKTIRIMTPEGEVLIEYYGSEDGQ